MQRDQTCESLALEARGSGELFDGIVGVLGRVVGREPGREVGRELGAECNMSNSSIILFSVLYKRR